MATRNRAIAALTTHVGFQDFRLKQIAARLGEAGVIASGAPGISPGVEVGDFVAILIAAATDAGLARACETVRVAGTLSPEGADVSGAPLTVPHDARRYLIELVGGALADQDARAFLRRSTIMFVTTWPEIGIRRPDGFTIRFREPGALAGHWPGSGHRALTEINGSALADAAISTFGD